MSKLQHLVYRLPLSLRRGLRRIPGADRARAVIAGKPGGQGPRSGMLRPVVYLPTWVRWDSMRQRPQYLLQAFAALGHPVFFVDPLEPAVRSVDGVTIVPGLEHVPSQDVILYVHFAPLRHLFGSFSNAALVYDILDDLSIYDQDEGGMPEERRVRSHHPAVMAMADVVIVSNQVLGEKHLLERSDVIHVGNGVDVRLFSQLAGRPADLVSDGRPIVGYHGMVSYWFDFDLLEEVARARPDLRFVLVGPTDERVAERAARVAGLANVEFIGERPSDTMPAYVQSFDVGTVWFQVNELTRGVTPLKVYEYLAAGVGCVSTPLPACVDEPAVRIAANASEFTAQLDLAAADRGDPRLRQAAEERDWKAVLAPVVARLDQLGVLRVP
jgi:glycosyltransferase involved in cell wall biosynthesis